MKQICIHCGRKSTGGSLWCQESYCSIDNMVTVFDYGETVGDLNIVKLLAVLRTSSIYEAERQGQKVLLKIAHAGFQERLKREACLFDAASGEQAVSPDAAHPAAGPQTGQSPRTPDWENGVP
ncbi:MAG: hypothetical protein IPM76_11850 [Chloroflexi bacterium]|nr:hypothetical protein [Chloroflexota bacterium]